jgi:hypothetical protein
MEKIKREEGADYALVITPAGEDKLSRELRTIRAKIIQLQNDLSDCRMGVGR